MYSPVNYWIMLCGDVVCAAVFLAVGVRHVAGTRAVAVLAVVAGFLAWGGVEYGVHRWILHGRPSSVQRAHARHHRDATALISSPLGVSTALACGLWAVLRIPFATGTAALVVFGLYAGYNGYVVLHHVQHHLPSVARVVPGLSGLVRAHAVHHGRYVVNYGVTTTWLDRVLGSDARVAPSAGPRDVRSERDRRSEGPVRA